MNYFLGIDNGGTTTKAALYTSIGQELCVESIETRMLTPQPGFSERDLDEMWDAICGLIRVLIGKSGVNPGHIKGIAVCGHGKGLYLWGKDGKPARNGIISTDNRAWEIVEKWKREGVEAQVLKISKQHILACQPVALLAWIKENEPATYQNIKWIFECKDYVRFRLTGNAMAELTDYSGANFLNLSTRNYDMQLLQLFGLTELATALPPLCTSTQVCGNITAESAALTGLLEGTPVAGGMFDIDACALAVGVTNPSHICMIAGTWSINEYLRREPAPTDKVLMNSLFCQPEYYLVEESSPTSASNLEWLIRTILPEVSADGFLEESSIYDSMNKWVASLPPQEFCPVFLPFLMGSNVHPNALGCFVGLSNYHTRQHLVRSVFEGVTFSHRYHLEKLLATREQPIESIRLAGGAAKSGTWVQMFADVMQIPVEAAVVNETGALGCAIAAAVATGEYADIQSAVNSMCTLKPAVKPNPANAGIYNRKYKLYLNVIVSLDKVWDDVQRLIDK